MRRTGSVLHRPHRPIHTPHGRGSAPGGGGDAATPQEATAALQPGGRQGTPLGTPPRRRETADRGHAAAPDMNSPLRCRRQGESAHRRHHRGPRMLCRRPTPAAARQGGEVGGGGS
jgi:hypothetical protein